MSGGRALGTGLLVGAGGIVLLLLAWLLVGGVGGGGIVLLLLLMLILAGPLAGAGWYILSRQPEEQRAEVAFLRKQRILDSDRVFRAQTAAALRDLAADPALPERQLRSLADELQDATHGSAAWQDLVQLDDSGSETLRRYDDLVRQRVRRLRDDPRNAQQGLRELRQAVDQREDLLVRGRVAPGVDPSLLLTSDPAPALSGGLEQIGVGDAVSREAVNYVVENVASYFAEGQRWKLARLVPTGPGATVAWLYVGPQAMEIALLDELPSAGDGPVTMSGHALPEVASGTAVADVTGGARTAEGVLVAYRRYREGRSFGLVEHWPDQTSRTYGGSLIDSSDLDVWPASAQRA
ncbi:MAG: hypothetical protein JO352_30445 [Chloroflexi bacterium]|nr:hypothetical protein [Chloroflexota bacterium]MBV9601747.1 hypothetical protein [Chloroflexota bacterium]